MGRRRTRKQNNDYQSQLSVTKLGFQNDNSELSSVRRAFIYYLKFKNQMWICWRTFSRLNCLALKLRVNYDLRSHLKLVFNIDIIHIFMTIAFESLVERALKHSFSLFWLDQITCSGEAVNLIIHRKTYPTNTNIMDALSVFKCYAQMYSELIRIQYFTAVGLKEFPKWK